MRGIFGLAMLLVGFGAASAAKMVPDSSVFWTVQGEAIQKGYYFGDSAGNIVRMEVFNKDSATGMWYKTLRLDNAFDRWHHMTMRQSQDFFGDFLYEGYHEGYLFDSAGHVLRDSSAKWSSTGQFWNFQERGIRTFDDAGNETSYLRETWDSASGNWIPRSRTTGVFSGGNLIAEERYSWNASSWVGSTKREVSRDAMARPLVDSIFCWDRVVMGWGRLCSTTDYAYTSNPKVVIATTTNFDSLGGSRQFSRLTDTLSARGDTLVHVESRKDTVSGGWWNFSSWTATYDSMGNQETRNYQSFDYYDHDITFVSRKEASYDSLGRELYSATWDGPPGALEGWQKYEHAYDAVGNVTLFQVWDWNAVAADWIFLARYEYSFDAAGNLLMQKHFRMAADSSGMEHDGDLLYYYNGVTSAKSRRTIPALQARVAPLFRWRLDGRRATSTVSR